MLAQETTQTTASTTDKRHVEVRIPPVSHYFPGYLGSQAVPIVTSVVLYSTFWSGIQLFDRGNISSIIPFWVVSLVSGAGMAMLFAWSQARAAAKRKPLLDFSDVKGTYAWQYIDLAASYEEVFATCEQMARSLARDDPERILAVSKESGVIVVERPIAFRTPDNEVNFRLDRYFSSDPEGQHEITRVQILGRALSSWTRPDAKLVRRIIDALKSEYSWIAEGPLN